MESINILEECRDVRSIVISGHIRPDGDCVGACLAMEMYLKKALPQADVKVCLEQPPEIYSCIRNFDKIDTAYDIAESLDVLIILDCEKSRLGDGSKLADMAKKIINIDHHVSNANGCGDVNYVMPDVGSTSELVFDLMEENFVDEDIAKAIYIGMIHDTGIFQYSCTSPKTLRTAAKLIEYGFDFPRLIDETFHEKTYVQMQIMGRALLESIIFMDGKCVVSSIDRKTMSFYDASPKDLDGIVSLLRTIKGVECAIFMYETGNLEYKVSLRSCQYIDVSRVASYFGGGGHIRAAGCTMNGTFYDVVNNISGQIELQMKEQQAKEQQDKEQS